jgi:hypothetical protein
MTRKLIATCVALTAFAALAVMPAMASASPVLTEGKEIVKPPAKILATQSGNILLTTSSGTVTCTKSKLTGTLITNTGTHIEGTLETATFTGEGTEERCKSTFPFSPQFKVTPENLHWCITAGGALPADTWTIRGGACTEAAKNLRFTLDSSFGNCTYELPSVTGTFETNKTPVTLKVGANQTFNRVAGSICPEKGTLSGGWTLETDVSPFTGLSIS